MVACKFETREVYPASTCTVECIAQDPNLDYADPMQCVRGHVLGDTNGVDTAGCRCHVKGLDLSQAKIAELSREMYSVY